MNKKVFTLTLMSMVSLSSLTSASAYNSDVHFIENVVTQHISSDNIVMAAVEGDLKKDKVKEGLPSDTELGKNKKIFDKDFNMLSIQEAFNDGVETDNVAIYDYKITETYPVYMRVNMATLINLPKWEIIKAFSLADDQFFTVTNFSDGDMLNQLVIQSNVGGIDTNLIVIGQSGKIYNFYLRSLPVDSDILPHFTVYLNANEPAKLKAKKAAANAPTTRKEYLDTIQDPINQKELERARADYLKSLDKPEGVNLDYSISGDLEIAPKAVYDRRGWTFFDFRGVLPSDRLPTISKVIDGYDAVQNYRYKDGFLIAESTSLEGWTLKNGDKVVCVERE